MSKFEDYKQLIFGDEVSKQALIFNVGLYGYKAENFEEAYYNLFFKVSDIDLQTILAPLLRNIAMLQLQDETSEVSAQFYSDIGAVFWTKKRFF